MSEREEDLKLENEGLRRDIEDLQFRLNNAQKLYDYDPKLAQAVAFLGVCVLRSGTMLGISNMNEVLASADREYTEVFKL